MVALQFKDLLAQPAHEIHAPPSSSCTIILSSTTSSGESGSPIPYGLAALY